MQAWYNTRMTKTPKRPAGIFQLAKLIGDIATGQHKGPKDDGKDPAAVELGRKGGLKGGKARAASLNKEQRSAIAKKAAKKRWDAIERLATSASPAKRRKVLSIDQD